MVIETKYYDELGVKPDATIDDIEHAFRQFMLRDDQNSHGTEKIQYVSMIYDILSNASQRKVYDLFGEATEVDGDNSEKLYFTEYTEKYEPLDMVNGYHRVEYNLTVSLKDLLNAVVRRLRVKRYIKCEECEEDNVSCERCDGKRTYMMSPFVVVIDAGDSSTKSYTLPGNPISWNYIPTLLEVNLTVEEHPLFKRKGIHMIMEMSFDFREALSGFNRVFKTIDDRIIHITKQPGETTHNGEQMVVRYEGLTYFCQDNTKKKGNLIIKCRVSWKGLDTLDESLVNLLKLTSPSDEKVKTRSENEEIYQLDSLSTAEKEIALNFDKGQQNDLETEYLQ